MRYYLDRILETIVSIFVILLMGAFGIITAVFLLLLTAVVIPFVLYDYYKNDIAYQYKR